MNDLAIERETLGRMVREAWVRWAQRRLSPKPSWLVPYDELSEPDKEADRQIGETMFLWSKIHIEAASSLELDALRDFAAWVETWVGNPVGAYSVSALDGLFGMTRDKLAALARRSDLYSKA